ncbi:MAG: DedA family protein [Planctomycetota bacterium]|jgi:membrane protein DedA with SNARE-associated domain
MEWIKELLQLNVELIEASGYAGVAILMFIESSFVPFPSEIVVPPAGYLAAKGRMNGLFVMAAAIGGSLGGAFLNYWLAIRVGRSFFRKYGKWVLLTEAKIEKAEAAFARHGEIATFVCRLIPGVRQLISIPAGMARMHLGKFAFFTGLGAGIWSGVLFGIGWSAAQGEGEFNLAMVKDQARHFTVFWLLPLLASVVLIYVLARRFRGNRADAAPREETEATP